MSAPQAASAPVWSKRFLWLALAALGVVYGDIGTSSLYAAKEAFLHQPDLSVTRPVVLGIISMMLWSLLLVVSFKYVLIVMRADNSGEGGIMALLALLKPRPGEQDPPRLAKMRGSLVLLAIVGTALLYGDGIITPAISVLSAVEGLEVASPHFTPFILPIAVILLIVLFAIQSQGTSHIGKLFGPILVVWFTVQVAMGIGGILKHPAVLDAINPYWAWHYVVQDPSHAFVVLGSVFLCVTGGEALYADMGHFGRRPIQIVWFCVVLPSMMLNYFGQGALILLNPGAKTNPFFALAPSWSVIPLVVLAALATLIASQALISAVYSITAQAQSLGYLPRMTIVHTSAHAAGQIYLPGVNWSLMVATIYVVLSFKTSGNLAAAYGIAVTGTMAITTILWAAFARYRWQWSRLKVLGIMLPLLVVDLLFLTANLLKIMEGGWFPLLIGVVIFIIMSTWFRGRQLMYEAANRSTLTLREFVAQIRTSQVSRVPDATAVFMYANADDGVPAHLLHYLRHTQTLHKRLVVMTVRTDPVPYVRNRDTIESHDLGAGVIRVIARRGSMQAVNMPHLVELLKGHCIDVPIRRTTFFLGRENIVATDRPGMALWRERLFGVLMRNARTVAATFGIPASQVVELGVTVEI